LVSEAKKLVDRFRSDDSGFASSKIIELLLEHEEAEPSIYGPISIQLAERAEKNKKFLVARTYWQLAAIFNRRLKNEQIEQHCLIRSAETHASEALEFLAGEKVSHLAAAHHFSCAVFALRQAGAPKERIEELHQKLVEEQKLGMEEMGAFSASPVDLSELADAARKMVRNKDLQTALIVLAFGRGLVDFENFKKDVIKSAGEHPFLALVPIATTDSQGRTTARRASLWDAEKGGNDEAVLLETFHRLSSIQ
jgi:hypothetical protein